MWNPLPKRQPLFGVETGASTPAELKGVRRLAQPLPAIDCPALALNLSLLQVLYSTRNLFLCYRQLMDRDSLKSGEISGGFGELLENRAGSLKGRLIHPLPKVGSA